MLSIIFGSFYS